ncbi:MAG TPA: SLBB domain-containing protein [Candidatus Koribacter sp.]|jgi:protein involved in polysaccharide export with SLBB domain
MWRKHMLLAFFISLLCSFATAQWPAGDNQTPTQADCTLDPHAPGCDVQGGSPLPEQNTPEGPSLGPQRVMTPADEGNPQDLNRGTNPSQAEAGKPTATSAPETNEATERQRAEARGKEQEQPENAFQNFVEIAIGKKLPMFGYGLFRNPPSTFAPAERIPITGNYVIGPGDELLISIWGQVTFTGRMIVDREGNIAIPHVGPVNVAGARYEQLHDRLTQAVGHYYKNFQLSVSLGRLRSIQVYVTGFARKPGNYTLSSLTTLVDALFASGGPSAQGSMRAIQLKRGGAVVSKFDLYDFLLGGDNSKDVPLQPEDVIFIPPVGPLAAIAGAVHVPAIYELGPSSTLGDEIAIAGGLSTVADGSRVTIERIDKHTVRSVEEVPLDSAAMQFALHDGDIVRVVPLSPRIENAVILRGNVALPGRYPYKPGMRVRDLIPNREFLLTPDFWKAQTAVKERDPYAAATAPTTTRDIELQNAPTNRQTNATTRQRTNEIAASPVPNPNNEKQPIRLSAPEINWDYAVIQRLNPVDLSTRLVPFNLGKAVAGDESANVLLMSGDILTIFSQRDIAVPRDEQTRFVTVEGEVRAAGVYRIEPGDTLRSLLRRAGGLTDKAYLYGTLVTRESAREQQQEMLDETTQVLTGQVQQRASSDTAGHPEDAAAIQLRSTAQTNMLARMQGIRASGRVVLEIKPSDKSIDDLPDIPMEDGDRVTIPQRLEMVNVVGAVYRQSSYVYVEGTNVRHYLRLAGSATQTADLKHALLVRADGSVLDRKAVSGLWRGGFYDVRVLPGDTLVIPTKLATGAFQRNLRDWTQIASQLALAGASLAVISGY